MTWLLTACSPAPLQNNAPPPLTADTAAAEVSAADTPSDTPPDIPGAASDGPVEASQSTAPACPDCDDDNVCTYDLCQPKAATCQHIPLPATTTCATDEDNCTGQWCDGAGHCVVYATGECG